MLGCDSHHFCGYESICLSQLASSEDPPSFTPLRVFSTALRSGLFCSPVTLPPREECVFDYRKVLAVVIWFAFNKDARERNHERTSASGGFKALLADNFVWP